MHEQRRNQYPFLRWLLPLFAAPCALALTAQTITGFSPATPIVYSPGATITLSATGGGSGNPVVFASITPSICTVSGNVAGVLSAGTCTLTANQAGNATYAAASQVKASVVINKSAQTIAFAALAGKSYGDAPFGVSAAASSGLPVAFKSTTTSVCTVSGTTVTLLTTGTCTIAANQSGNASYSAAAQVAQSFAIAKAGQAINFPALPGKNLGIAPFTVSASASSGLAVTFKSSTTSLCTISGATVTLVKVGTCTIAADQAGNANYSAAPQVSQSFAVAPALIAQTITGFAPPAAVTFGAGITFSVSATGGGSGNPVVFSTTTGAVCRVAGNVVSVLSAGTCTLKADQAGNSIYSAAPQATASVAINKASQTIIFNAIPNSALNLSPITVQPSASSGLTVAVTSATTTVCAVSVATVTLIKAGTCTLRANQAGNANYNAATQVSQSFTIRTAGPTVTINAPANDATFPAPATIAFTYTTWVPAGSTLTRISLYQNGVLATSITPGTGLILRNVPPGTYRYTLTATDNYGVTATSQGITVVVAVVTKPPEVTLVEPTSGISYDNAVPIRLSAAVIAKTYGATIAKVDFYDGTTLLGTMTAPTSWYVSYTWSGASTGWHTLTAVATDSLGNIGASPVVSIVIDGPDTCDAASALGGNDKAITTAALDKLPLSFEENVGQSNAAVRFLARGAGFQLFLTGTERAIALRAPALPARRAGAGGSAIGGSHNGVAVRLRFVGANPYPVLEGLDPLDEVSNYLFGDNPAKWRTGVRHFARARYREVYPGIDEVHHGERGLLESDFVVAPGAEPEAIRMSIDGVDDISLDESGDLLLKTALGTLIQKRPLAYQQIRGRRQVVAARYRIEPDLGVTFALGDYDRSVSLVIDPVLTYSTLLGGTDRGTHGYAIAVSRCGEAFVAGSTFATDFPATPGAFNASGPHTGASMGFISKLNRSGSGLVYSTYLTGASGLADTKILALALDATGRAYVAGSTDASDFPTTNGAGTPTKPDGGTVGFATKLNRAGTGLDYSTYLQFDQPVESIAVDAARRAYIVAANSIMDINEIASGGTYRTSVGGGAAESKTVFQGVAVDAAGNAYVAGITSSVDLPVSAGAFQPSNPASDPLRFETGYVVKFDRAGNREYATYLGATSSTQIFGIAIDAAGNAYVAGAVASGGTVPNLTAPFTTFNANADDPGNTYAFAAKLNPSGTQLSYFSRYGGANCQSGQCTGAQTWASGIAVDSNGGAWITGPTHSNQIPLVQPLVSQFNAAGTAPDLFAARLAPDGTRLEFSTLLGGQTPIAASTYAFEVPSAFGIAVDSAGSAFIGGNTNFSDFPTTPGAFKTTLDSGAGSNAFVVKIGEPDPNAYPTVTLTGIADGAFLVANSGTTYTGAVVTLNAAAAPGNTLKEERISLDGSYVFWTTVGQTFTANYTLNPLGPGMHSVYAGVTDGFDHATSSAPIRFVVNPANASPPAITITAPANGASVTGPGPITLASTVTAASGKSIASVAYYQGDALIGKATAAPFSYAWNNVSPGRYSIIAMATDSAGSMALSAPITLTVTAPQPGAPSAPTLVSATPGPGSASLAFAAPASDGGAPITSYTGKCVAAGQTNAVATAAANATSILIAGMTAGAVYGCSVTATNSLGASPASNGLSVTPMSSPGVAIMTPANNAVLGVNSNVETLVITAAGSKTVARIEVLDGSTQLVNYVPAGAFSSINLKLTWRPSSVGTHVLSARMTDSAGAVMVSSAINISVVNAPAATLGVNGKFFLAPADVDLYAAASSPNGSIVKVEFLNGAGVIATLTVPPYSYRWRGVASGSYSLAARATDSAGVSTVSAPVNVRVGAAMSIAVDAGIDGRTVNDDTISFGGTVDAPVNSGVDVNGRLGVITEDGRFFFNSVPLAAGANTLAVTVTNIDGQSVTRPVTVNSTGTAPFVFAADNPVGFPPLATSFTLKNRGGVPFSRIELSCNDNGTADATFATVAAVSGIACSFGAPGTARARITVYDATQTERVIFTDTQTMFEASVEATDRMLRGLYGEMLGKLKAGNIDGASRRVSAGANGRFTAIFNQIGANLPAVVDQLGSITSGTIGQDFAEYVVTRSGADGPQVFMIHLILAGDGIWRIDTM